MDPAACLRDADQAISDLDLDTAMDRLHDYRVWRTSGGFEPIEVAGTLLKGDAFADWCDRRIRAIFDQSPPGSIQE